MRISDWSSDVCSSDLVSAAKAAGASISAATTRKLAAWRIVLNLDLALHLDLRRIEIGLPAFGFDGAIRGVAANRLVGADGALVPVDPDIARGDRGRQIVAGFTADIDIRLQQHALRIDRKSTRLNSSH